MVSKHEAEIAKKLIGQFQIQVEETVIGDVKVFELIPPALPKGHQDKVLLHIHGGGYVFHPGYAHCLKPHLQRESVAIKSSL